MQLMEVVYGVQDNDWLVKLLRGMMFGPDGGDKQKKVNERLSKCTAFLSMTGQGFSGSRRVVLYMRSSVS